MIRTSVVDLRVMGRNTQGVRLIRLSGEDVISSIAKIEMPDEEEIIDALVEGENPEEGESSVDLNSTSEGETPTAESENETGTDPTEAPE